MIINYKYKLKLTKEQSTRIDSWINTSRFIYNLALETKIAAYNQRKVNYSGFDLSLSIVAVVVRLAQCLDLKLTKISTKQIIN